MNEPNQNDELNWLAFRYVAGELTPAEVEQFELQLATDQSAREAVAQSVELYHAVSAVEATVPAPVTLPVRTRKSAATRFAWISLSAAAAIVLVLVANWANREPAQSNRVSPDLVKAWTAVQAELAMVGETAGDSDHAHRPTVDELSEAELAAMVEEEIGLPMDSPSWMTAGVQGLSARPPMPLDAPESEPQDN